ncbi:MAG: hypothetical protein MRZ65_01265 [Lachnospiraceae bacterium]|nr:hypothetical protein [Lachnospiraceae bacterium]
MEREADSTIKGFMYQFNLSLNEILQSNGESIILEGIIEDIDKISPSEVIAIQCKYHEAVDAFNWSKVYKPILQMLKTYTETSVSNIKFVLHAFFPGEARGDKTVSIEIIKEMLNTKNEDYICNYIAFIKKTQNEEIDYLIQKPRKSKEDKKKIVDYYMTNALEPACDIEEFVGNRFTFRIGKSYDELEKENIELLEQVGFIKKDIEDIVYPNAIQKIATLSMFKDDSERKITKEEMIAELQLIKKTAISRWTKELANYKKLLTNRRKQLSTILNHNYRKRCLVFNPVDIENFDDEIVVFIKNFVDIYCTKTKLHIPAVICILGYDKEKIDTLVGRLFQKEIEVETGYRGSVFYAEAFNRKPGRDLQKDWMEYRIKICGDLSDSIDAINNNKPDDIFQFTEHLPENISIQDINVEMLDVQNFDQIEFLLKMKDEVEI